MLECRNVDAGYGKVQILHGLDFVVPTGGLSAILGSNGSGKSTAMKTVAGLVKPTSGEILLDGHRIDELGAHSMAAEGLSLVPQGKEVLAGLSVEENILVGAYHRRKDRHGVAEDLEMVYQEFPRLRTRRKAAAGLLSGGERQMLSLGRALMARPRMLLLDEPSAALAPKVVGEISDIIRKLRGRGLTMLLVEQNVSMALELADEIHILREGRFAYSRKNGPDVDIEELREFYLGKGRS
ncbi:ABC transporter ATP-binding protein [Pinisolibacter aquiterrae]|uniref:ABC transporter ATP-binding protein n=1 Tax=Pinisolibacter aquiterrae TaxID=2815579 RepID=UPI001C3CCAD6|nr:ABC transporter ATP-binding protein [Pinisolibacter aquiterrae]MBV5263824.1 ABC transporter ATP-binding protein [Pinisolibacter aquiterrae]MCC8237326.1 ABC transporter ATP-binding protein [Pinisolibacter aquiterrae]